MNHECFDEFKELVIKEGELRRHEAVDVLWSAQLGMGLQEDDDVCMWKPPLLKLNGVKEAIDSTKDTILNLLDEGVKLCMEDTHNHIRAIRSSLARQESMEDVRPLGICSHGHKEITTSKVAIDGQGILAVLLHISGASRKG
jgi:hypothetical protein